jgi:type III secretory pathway component EscU
MTGIYNVFLVVFLYVISSSLDFLGQKQAHSKKVKLLEEEVKNTRKMSEKELKADIVKIAHHRGHDGNRLRAQEKK